MKIGPYAGWRLVDGRDHASASIRLRVRGRIGTARLIDAAMARSGLVRPAVFVSGFWRSGTTWMQECLAEALQAKTVFEPLSPLDPARGTALASRFAGDEDAAQAWIPDGRVGLEAIWAAFDDAMASRGCSAFGMSCRWSVAESLRRAVVVKDVRSQLILDLIHARYAVPVVHIRRHPCAVVASLLQADWHWSFSRVRLRDVLPEQGPVDEVDARQFDDDALARIAACWAWSEKHAATALAGRRWGYLVTYEALVRDPDRLFRALCAHLGLTSVAEVAFDRASATIRAADRPAGTDGRERWRQTMSTPDIDRIERIATAIHPSWREAWEDAEPSI